jgi:hypothetical protein
MKEHGKGRRTENYRVCVKGGEHDNNGVDYYGILKEVIELQYLGHPMMSVVLFKCDWFDPIPNRELEYTLNTNWWMLTVRGATPNLTLSC